MGLRLFKLIFLSSLSHLGTLIHQANVTSTHMDLAAQFLKIGTVLSNLDLPSLFADTERFIV